MTVAAMKQGLKTMQSEYKKLDIGKIEDLQDEMADMLYMNNEIQDALSKQYDTPDVIPDFFKLLLLFDAKNQFSD